MDKNNDNILRGPDGEPRLTNHNETVPAVCPHCGAEVHLYLRGEPVFLCNGKDEHYFGTLKFPANLFI